jgi:hypothetical protein
MTRTNLILDCSQPFNPVEFINGGWGVAEQDERSLAITEVDFEKILLETCLKEGEVRIMGEEKLRRFKEEKPELIPLGGQHCQALWRDYKARGKDSVLERMYKERGIIYLDFFGLILRLPNGRRLVLYFYRDEGEWDWNYDWLDDDWGADGCSAVLASSELTT